MKHSSRRPATRPHTFKLIRSPSEVFEIMDRLAEWHIVPVLSWGACHVAVSFPPLHKFVNAVTKFEFASSLQEAFAAMFLDPQNRRNTTWRVLLGCVLGVSLLSARAWLC